MRVASIALRGAKANSVSNSATISSDGRYVAFGSVATSFHPDDTDATGDVFVRDLQAQRRTVHVRAP